MVQRVTTVAFEGIEARAVDVQVQVAPGLPAFNIVGLPDKAVSEAKERVRAALIASGLALPARRSYQTAAGLVIESLQKLPKTGEITETQGWRFEVVDMDGRRVDKLLATRLD